MPNRKFKPFIAHDKCCDSLLVREDADCCCRLWQKAQVEVESMTISPASRLLRASREEVKRLRKAGDALADAVGFAMARIDRQEPKLVQDWNAAKDGKQNQMNPIPPANPLQYATPIEVLQGLNAENDMLRKENAQFNFEFARLKAEFDSFMTNPTSRLLRVSRAECEVLKAENADLRKAVDTLDRTLVSKDASYEVGNASDDWDAAKGDKESAVVSQLNRYNIANIQAQQTLGGNALIADQNGILVMYSDYKFLESKVTELEVQANRDSFCYTEMCKCFMAERIAHKTLKDKLKNDTRI